MPLLKVVYMSVICPDPIYLFENYLTMEAVCPSETPVTQPQVWKLTEVNTMLA
jgi:serine/threonine-protein kinase RIO1